MTCLVIVEHDNIVIKSATLNAVTAATEIGGRFTTIGGSAQAESETAVSVKNKGLRFMADSPEYVGALCWPKPIPAKR